MRRRGDAFYALLFLRCGGRAHILKAVVTFTIAGSTEGNYLFGISQAYQSCHPQALIIIQAW